MIRWGVLKPPLSIIVYSLRMERLALNDVRITRRSSECWNVKVFDDLILWNRNSSHLFLTWSFVTSHSCLSTVSSQCHDVVSLFSPCVKQKYNRTEPGKARELFLSLFFFYYYYFYDLFEMEINCLLYQSETVLLVLLILNPVCQSEPLDKCCRQPVMSDWWMNHFCWLISGKV